MSNTEKDKKPKVAEQNMEEKILQAAEYLFLRNGFDLTTTVEIAKVAGCKQALVHYYFRTKEKLFYAVLGGKIQKVFKNFACPRPGEGNFEDKLTHLIELHYDVVRENPGMALFFINEFSRHPEMLENLTAELELTPRQTWIMFESDLRKAIEAGRIRPVSLPQLILNVISLNAFPYLIKPVYAHLWNYDDEGIRYLLDDRKQEVVVTILNSLRP
ncbi:MAG: TetR/AcrR family transcriptional regulator [Rikenellaceae bacterium]|nr:TetR/AcrR family transcriptional regulator [Rikenellaceae bacterium]